MSGQPSNVWHTAARSRNSTSHSRTPQSRSGNASPAQQSNPAQSPKQDAGKQHPNSNAWTQKAGTVHSGSNTVKPNDEAIASKGSDEDSYTSANNFNAEEAKSFLAREAVPAPYKPAEGAHSRNSGGPWGAHKQGNMANGQPFFMQLAKQIASLEGGG